MRQALVLITLLAAAPATPSGPAATEEPLPYEPTSAYAVRTVEGWTVRVHNRLLGQQKDLGDRTLRLLEAKLYEVNRMLPQAALDKLHGVPIWVEAASTQVKGLCYHPSGGWLRAHGFNPDKARSVEIGNPKAFGDWTHHQPAMVLHELAHAYHHQVLGYGNSDVKAAYEHAVEGKLYESVLYWDGTRKRAYAMNNDQEYFAELSEAYFGTNDIYPFVRAEVREHDPEGYRMLRKVWGGKPADAPPAP
jgi:hypothetical protein